MLFALLLCVGAGSLKAAEPAEDDPGRERLSGEVTITEENSKSQFSFASLLSLSSMGNPYTGSTYTHSTAYDGYKVSYGIDVSKYQGDINWTSVKADGVEFAFIRAAYRGYGTAGTLAEDTYFTKNIINATGAGIKTGAYIFSQATTTAEAEEEAAYLIKQVSGYNITMPLVIDFEYATVNGKEGGRLYDANLTAAQATKICNAFCAKIADAGYTPMVYANKSMLESHLNAGSISNQYKIWLANYTTETEYSGAYAYWQYSSKGTVNGISGSVDCNFWYQNSEEDNTTGNESSGTGTSGDASSTVPDSPEGTEEEEVVEPDPEPAIIAEKVTGLKKSASTTSSITITWTKITNAAGYQVYRATSLNGTYTKVKTITKGAAVSYKQTGLISGKEYYFKVRAYQTIDGKNYYSSYSSKLTSYTKSNCTRTALAKANTVMRKTTSTTGVKVRTVGKGATLNVLSFAYDTKGNIWYRAKYTRNNTTYTGYLYGGKVTIYKYAKAAATVYMRKNAGTKYAIVRSIAKSTKVTVLSKKTDSKGVIWYYCKYTKSGITYKGYICGNYIKLV